MKNILSTWFYAEHKGNESSYPSVGSNTSDLSFQVVYWKCIVDLFESALLTQTKQVDYYFFTNTEVYPSKEDMNGLDLKVFFQTNNIHVVKTELSHMTPKDWFGQWRNQFYVFDVLEYFTKNINDANIMVLDSDCIIRSDLTPVFSDIEKYESIQYDCGNNDTVQENGVSHIEMTDIYESFYGDRPEQFIRYKGGEFIGVTSTVAQQIVETFHSMWSLNYKRYEQGLNKLNEEAHFLSVINQKMGIINNIGNQYIKRMWTALKYDTVQPGDENLIIWHLPSEKRYGLEKLYDYFAKEHPDKEQYLAYSSRVIGIPGSKFLRKLKRLLRRVVVGK